MSSPLCWLTNVALLSRSVSALQGLRRDLRKRVLRIRPGRSGDLAVIANIALERFDDVLAFADLQIACQTPQGKAHNIPVMEL